MMIAAIVAGSALSYALIGVMLHWLGFYLTARFDWDNNDSAWAFMYDVKVKDAGGIFMSTFWPLTWPGLGAWCTLKWCFKRMMNASSLRESAIKAGTRD